MINLHRIHKTAILIILIVIFWISLSNFSFADTVNMESSHSLVFLGNENLPPMVYVEDGKPKGVVVDIVTALGQKMRKTIDIKPTDWAEAQKIVEQGGADALIQINESDERKKIYDFSEPLLESKFSIFTHTAIMGISGTVDLRGLRVAVESKGLPITILQEDPLIKIVDVNSVLDGFQLLKEDKVDAVISDEWVGEYIIASNGINDVKIAGNPIAQIMSSIAVRKGDTELLAAINKGLIEMKNDGTYKNILKKWQPKEVIFLTKDQIKLKQYETSIGVLGILILVITGGGLLLAVQLCKSKKIEMEIKSQKELLEAVIETMYDALVVYDKKGSIILMNAEARNQYHDINDQTKVSNIHDGYKFFDLDNNSIPVENMPARRVLKGEKIRNERIIIQNHEVAKYTEINATPIFDDENNLVLAVVSHHDISESIKNQMEIKNQQEIILKVEAEKNEALKNLLEMKDEFFINVSHELKTPINVIYSTVQLFNMYCSNGSLDEKKDLVIKYIESIKKNSHRLSKLVNNIVDLSKIQAGFFELCLSNNNIVEVVEEIVMSITDYTDIKGLNIIFDTDVEENIIACDPEKIERIVLNLISNAVKFSNKGEEIFVEIKDKNDFIEISVKDNGIGIKENDLSTIFDKYKQVDKSLVRNAEGTGVGLSLVKSLVELHGGNIFVESEYGSGSKFTVALPARKVMQENIILSNKIRSKNESVRVEFSDIYS